MNRHGHYVFQHACEFAQFRKHRSATNLSTPAHVLKLVRKLLIEEDWSPQKISGWLLENKQIRISHERIYQEIRADKSGMLREHTRHKMKYHHHSFRRKPTKVRNIPNRISIHDRPPEADGIRFGDWELDLIVGKGQRSALVTVTERLTNYTLMEYIPNKRPQTEAETVWKMLGPFIGDSLKTITTDNGVELMLHEQFARKLKTKVYFADSYCFWQKGVIEYANKLIRQYFPKGTDSNLITKERIMEIQKKNQPATQKKLYFKSPTMFFYNLCH